MHHTNAVYIEYCINCSAHAWCTKHDEAKYKTVFQQAREEIEQTFEELAVYSNVGPLDRKPISPRLGSFEIIFRGTIIYSKLKSGAWPLMEIMISRIKAVMEGRDFDDAASFSQNPMNEKSKMPPSDQSRQKIHAINGNRHRNNRSYAADLSQRSVVKNSLRAEKSMLLGNNFDSDETTPSLPKIKQRKRDATPARLEGLNRTYAQLEPLNHNPKVFRVDKDNKKIFKLVNNNNQYYFSHKKLDALDQASPGSNSTNNSYYGSIKKNVAVAAPSDHHYDGDSGSGNQIGSIHDGYLEENQIFSIKENRIPLKDVHTIQRPKVVAQQQSQFNADSELDATVFSHKSHVTEDNEDNLSPPVKKVNFNLQNKQSQQELIKRMNIIRSGSNSAANSISSKQNSFNQKYELREQYPSHKDLDGKFKLDLRRLSFPDEKISQVKVPKNKITKKKITAVADENEDCKVGVYSNTPEILALDSNEILVQQGSNFKIPLKFEYQYGQDELKRFYIFVLKQGRPWQKIIIDVHFT